MDTVISLLVLSTLPQLAKASSVTSLRAEVEVGSDTSWIFSGEGLRLRCSVPDGHRSNWEYLWFREGEKYPQLGREISLWNAKVKDSGKFSCQGVRDTLVGDLYTLKSLPVEVRVDGGFAILNLSPHPGLVGGTVTMTCRVRHNPPVVEKILYKDGVEVMRQSGLEPHFHLHNVTLEDAGLYSCRASWDVRRQTISVISAPRYVQIKEFLSQPVLEIEADLNQENEMKLTCHVQYNAPPPAPPIHFYFYRNNIRLGTAASENHYLVRQTPGLYSCKVRVPELGHSRWSEPRTFGEVSEPQTIQPPRPDSNHQQPSAATTSPESSASPTAQSMSEEFSTTTSSNLQYTEEPGDLSEGLWSSSEETENFSKESGDIPKESGDIPKESEDIPKESEDIPKESEDIPKESGDIPKESGDIPKGSRCISNELWDFPEGSGDFPEGSGDLCEESEDFFEGSGDFVEGSGDFVEGSGDFVEGSGDFSEVSEDFSEESGDFFQDSEDMSEDYDYTSRTFW